MNVVLDTNVIVSAVWSPGRNAGIIVGSVFSGKLTACYDDRIIEEYERVMRYPKLHFTENEISAILEPIIKNGFSVIAEPISDITFIDESDRKFYEVAKSCDAILITGNLKHYPDDRDVMSLSEFCEKYLAN